MIKNIHTKESNIALKTLVELQTQLIKLSKIEVKNY